MMFGHDDNQDNQTQGAPAVAVAPATPGYPIPNDLLIPDVTSDPPMPDPLSLASPQMNLPAVSPATTAPPADLPSAPPPSMTPTPTVTSATPLPVPSTDELLNIKQDALQQLSPLVGHLEQTPEEKFRTTMMMIQASDDQTLIRSAYETAKQIVDEKTRAQAILDVVNEINYFTQQHNPS